MLKKLRTTEKQNKTTKTGWVLAGSLLRLRCTSQWGWRTFYNPALSSDLQVTQKHKTWISSTLQFRHLHPCLFGPQWVPRVNNKPLNQGSDQLRCQGQQQSLNMGGGRKLFRYRRSCIWSHPNPLPGWGGEDWAAKLKTVLYSHHRTKLCCKWCEWCVN